MVLLRFCIETLETIYLGNVWAPSVLLAVIFACIAWNVSRYRLQSSSISNAINQKKFDVTQLNESVEHVPFKNPIQLSGKERIKRAEAFYELMNARRTLRFSSSRPVPIEIIATILKTAGTAPSAAHRQPWTFAVVATDEIKRTIRTIVEAEEKQNYEKRMGQKWVEDLKFVRTNWIKEYIEVAPYIVLVFKQNYGETDSGERVVHYYAEMSVMLSVGIMLAAIQNAGLVTLTSTPMNAGPAICRLLNRPSNEKLLLLMPLGYPAEDATVPDLCRKDLSQTTVWY